VWRGPHDNTRKVLKMREVWNFVLGCLVGGAITAMVFIYPIVCERNELQDTLNRVTIELDGRDIVIDWNNLLKKE